MNSICLTTVMHVKEIKSINYELSYIDLKSLFICEHLWYILHLMADHIKHAKVIAIGDVIAR